MAKTQSVTPGTDSQRGDEPILPAIDLIYNWRAAWLRVVARSWDENEASFLQLLLDAPKQAFAEMGYTGIAYDTDGTELCLWDLLDIEVVNSENPEEAKYDPVNGYTSNGWNQAVENGRLKMKLTLVRPPAPEPKWRAKAICDLEAAGKVYPITAT